MKTVRLALALSLVLMCGGCRGKASGPSASGAGVAPPRSNNPDVYEDRFQIGRTAMADGKVMAETDKFTAGDTIHIAFVVRNAPAGASAKVIWKRLDGNVSMSEEQKSLASSGFVWFAVKDTSAWPPGAYQVQKLFGRKASSGTPIQWKGLGTKDLTISPR